jgi:hypothetical protein
MGSEEFADFLFGACLVDWDAGSQMTLSPRGGLEPLPFPVVALSLGVGALATKPVS